MKKEICKKLIMSNIHPTTTILQMAYQSIAKLEGIIEDVQITMDSWNYPTYFLILKTKAHNGYLIILGRPWLATADAFINCRSRDIIIYDGHNSRKISLYPPVKLTFEYKGMLWIDEPKSFAVLSTITINEHVEELEEIPKFFKEYTTLEIVREIGESSRSNLQNKIFNIIYQYQETFLSLFKFPLTHIVPKGEAFREIIKVFHSLFLHPCSLNSFVQLLDHNNLT